MSKYQKVSVNINKSDLEKIDRLVDESDDFSVTRTTIFNKAIKLYLKYIEEQKGA